MRDDDDTIERETFLPDRGGGGGEEKRQDPLGFACDPIVTGPI